MVKYGFGVAGLMWGGLSLHSMWSGDSTEGQILMILSLVNFILFKILD